MGHGKSFNFIMRTVFNVNREGSLRCHNYKVTERRKRKRFLYTCDKCGEVVQYTPTQHKSEQSRSHAMYEHRCFGGARSPMTFMNTFINI